MNSSGVLNTSYIIYDPIGKSGKFKAQEIYQSTAFEVKNEFSVFSVPLSCLYVFQHKKLYAGFGPEFQIQFISSKVASENPYSDYYELKTGNNYSSRYAKTGFVAGFKIESGYVNNNFSIGLGADLQQRLTPYNQNSLYSFSGSALTLDLSFRYFIKKIRN
ncbi:MAG: hypothetical protein H7329_11300 [Opitutaceae bacterium]|nr:hypothetical protein [Cytophagales bacterium]